MSKHPVDGLIRELIATRRQATPKEVGWMLERIRFASFPTAKTHFLKRVQEDAQWVEATTIEEYLEDLKKVAVSPASRLGLYQRRGGSMSILIGDTKVTVSPERLGERALPRILVLYSADRGIIISGYQFSEMSAVTIPEDTLWLK